MMRSFLSGIGYSRLTGNKVQTRTHRCTVRGRDQMNSLMYLGCHQVESLRAWGTVWYIIQKQRQRARQKYYILGFPLFCAACRAAKRSRECLPNRVTFWSPRACATVLGRDRHLRRGVHPGPLLAPQPRARETIRGQMSRVCKRAKENIWCLYMNMTYSCSFLCFFLLPYFLP